MFIKVFYLDVQMILLSMDQTDAMLFLEGTTYAVNKRQDPHPYIITNRFLFMTNYPIFVCPLPRVSQV